MGIATVRNAGMSNEKAGRRARRWTCAMLLAGAVSYAAPALTTNDLCGATIFADVNLDHDLTCTGDGLIVAADGIRIDLHGHTLLGPGSGIGILVTGRSDVTIMGGIIRNFAVAVRVNTSTDVVIKTNQFIQNAEGIDLQAGSVGNTVKNNAFSDSSIRAIMLRSNSRDNDIKDNTFTMNRIGVLVFGGVDNSLKSNLISGSTEAGIRLNVIAHGNVVKDNLLQSNVAGIDFVVTPTGSSAGNEFKGNTIAFNRCGVRGPTAGNEFKDNRFENNVADTCLP
jgi:parallel beta-helix repeat protein